MQVGQTLDRKKRLEDRVARIEVKLQRPNLSKDEKAALKLEYEERSLEIQLLERKAARQAS